jgi:c-di-GMP-binding flagellar brake protein YcgR
MTDSNMFIERRAHPRVSLKIPVQFHLIDGDKEIESLVDRKKTAKSGISLDMSLGGIQLSSDTTLKLGHIMRVDFSVPNHHSLISAFAEVIWSNQSGAGLHFLTMKDSDFEVLKNFINKALGLDIK